MCPGMADEALRLGDASAEKVEQDLASPMGLLGWQGRIWVLCDASTSSSGTTQQGLKTGERPAYTWSAVINLTSPGPGSYKKRTQRAG